MQVVEKMPHPITVLSVKLSPADSMLLSLKRGRLPAKYRQLNQFQDNEIQQLFQDRQKK